MKTLAFGTTAGCIIFVCGKHPLDGREWDEYLFFLREQFGTNQQRYPFLVHAAGAGPTAPQRQELNDVIAPIIKVMTCAVMTTSQLVRGIVTMLGWIYPVYSAFRPDQLDDALQFLRVEEPDRPKVRKMLADLKDDLVRP